jgi:4-amino-4-deoxy-L-arabinose transferase-like glycosyltransferase
MIDFDQFTRGFRPIVLLILMMSVLSLPGVFKMPVMDRDEARFTQVTSQMLETDDYVVIRYHDGLRNKKPVGIHWLQSASVATFSNAEKREIWAYRIPSFLGAVLAAIATFWIGSSLFSRQTGFAGGIFLGASLLLSSEAHIAKTDAAMVGFICLALACLAELRKLWMTQQSSKKKTEPVLIGTRSLSVIFWIALAIGVLIKGPVAPMVVGLTIGALIFW